MNIRVNVNNQVKRVLNKLVNGAIIILLVIISFQALAEEINTTESYSTAQLNALQEDIFSIMVDANIPGASISLVTKDRVIWAGGVGIADRASRKNVSADTVFRLGSVSKAFTSLAVMKLVEQGKLSLDTPIRSILPDLEFENPWQQTYPVTIAHVLEHTTGFDDMHFAEIGKTDNPNITLAEGLAFHPDSRVSRWAPGTHMSYSNSGPAIGARTLEVLVKKEFETFSDEVLFKPLNMKDTGFHYPANFAQLATGYRSDGNTTVDYEHIIVRPSGGANSTANDMANYLQLMLNRGSHKGTTLFQPETINRIEQPETTLAAKAGYKFGYGLGNYASVYAGHKFHGHSGSIGGFTANTAYSTELGVGFYISTNSIHAKMPELSQLIAEFLVASKKISSPPTVQLSSKQLNQLEGYYQAVTPRSQITNFIIRFIWLKRIFIEGGRIYEEPVFGGETKELFAVSATSFRQIHEPEATLFLVNDPAGNHYLQSGFEGQMQKISALYAWLHPVGLAFTLLSLTSAILLGLCWLVGRYLKKFKTIPPVLVMPQFLASVCLSGSVFITMMTLKSVDDLVNVSTASLSLFIGTSIFTILVTLMSFRLIFPSEQMRGASAIVRVWSSTVSVACLIIFLFLFSEGIIGIRLWAY